jgi:cyclopropane-fatty-acyl-phospholipid synthase
MRWLPRIFERAIRKGRLTLVGPDGATQSFGGKGPGPEVRLRLTDAALDWKIFLNPELNATEAIMNGGLVVEEGSIHDLIALFFVNKRQFDMTPTQIFWNGLSRRFRRLMQNNDLRRAKRRVAHHYDLGNDFYRLWLDTDMQYSCGYFPQGDETLEAAQLAKKRHIASKLALQPGQTVLDIGSGWGGMAIYLAKVADVRVVGVTLSTEQLEVAQERARAEGVAGRVTFRLQDYREITETFDRIVSVGMLEHVGVNYLDRYFLDVRDRLAPEGVALIHSISSKAPPGITGPFLRKYIFPGGYAPSMSEAFGSVERSGLWTLDCEVWRLHYAETLRHWRERFYACREKVVEMYDERFARMWEIYLSASECAFRYGSSCVFQMQLARTRDAVPISRDYMIDVERRLAEAEQAQFLAKTA